MLTQIRNLAGARPQTHSAAPVVLLTAIACAILLGGGCSGQTAVTNITPPPSTPPPSATISFSCDSPDPSCTAGSSAKSIPALIVTVAWSNVPTGAHAQTVRFFLPDGYVYQAIETGFAVAQKPTGSASAVARLPVAGSFITQRDLTKGNWKVEVSLDGNVVGSTALHFNP